MEKLYEDKEIKEFRIGENLRICIFNDGDIRANLYALDRSRSIPGSGEEYWVAVNLSQDEIQSLITILKE